VHLEAIEIRPKYLFKPEKSEKSENETYKKRKESWNVFLSHKMNVHEYDDEVSLTEDGRSRRQATIEGFWHPMEWRSISCHINHVSQ